MGGNVQRIGTSKLAIRGDAAAHSKSRRNIEIVRGCAGYVEQADSPNSRDHGKNITLLHGDWCWQGEAGNRDCSWASCDHVAQANYLELVRRCDVRSCDN